jgi:hypothetical protein
MILFSRVVKDKLNDGGEGGRLWGIRLWGRPAGGYGIITAVAFEGVYPVIDLVAQQSLACHPFYDKSSVFYLPRHGL